MAQKSRKPNFNQALEALRAHSFDVQPYSGVAEGVLITKNGVGAVLVPATDKDAPGVLMIRPGILVRGEVALLVDRGYQKFFKSSKHEVPATAILLHKVHAFSEELKKLTGIASLYNESLGTVSDLYVYDRLKGREVLPFETGQPVLPVEKH